MKHDPIEEDPKLGPIIRKALRSVKESLANDPMKGERGFCHHLWGEQKRYLKDTQGIELKSPREMNPGVIFD